MMVIFTPLTTNTTPAIYIPDTPIEVYAARNALDATVAVVAETTPARPPAPADDAPKLDPRVSKVLDLYVREAKPGEDRIMNVRCCTAGMDAYAVRVHSITV